MECTDIGISIWNQYACSYFFMLDIWYLAWGKNREKHAMDDMKQEMITIAAMMAQKVVAASIDTSIQDSLVDETLKEMGESTWLS